MASGGSHLGGGTVHAQKLSRSPELLKVWNKNIPWGLSLLSR